MTNDDYSAAIARHGPDPLAPNILWTLASGCCLSIVAGGQWGRQPIPEARDPEFEGQTARLVDFICFALGAMSHATAALFGPDPPMVDSVDAAYEVLSMLHHEIEDRAAMLLATRGPSTQAKLPATLASLCTSTPKPNAWGNWGGRSPISRGPGVRGRPCRPTLGVLRELSEVCLDLAAKAADVVDSHGAVAVAELDGSEDDRLRQLRYWKLLSPSGVIHVGAAIDLTLAARCYERFAEHAVAVAHRGGRAEDLRAASRSPRTGPD